MPFENAPIVDRSKPPTTPSEKLPSFLPEEPTAQEIFRSAMELRRRSIEAGQYLPPVDLHDSQQRERAGRDRRPEGSREARAESKETTYTVKPGDSLWKIARGLLKEQTGQDASNSAILRMVLEIARRNGLADPSRIIPGQVLQIPGQQQEQQRPTEQPRQPEQGQQSEPRRPRYPWDLPPAGGEQPRPRPQQPTERTPQQQHPQQPTERTPQQQHPQQPTERTPQQQRPQHPTERTPQQQQPQRPTERTPQQQRPQQPTEQAPQPKPVDEKAMEAAVKSIREATKKDQWVDTGTDEDAIMAVLKDKTEAERKAIARIYKDKYGKTLEDDLRSEMSGTDLDRALTYLNRKDGNAMDATIVKAALDERKNWFFGRSDRNCEKDVRDTISTMNSKQIQELDQEYKTKYGKSLEQALFADSSLSSETKEALKIYLKGTDKRTDEDTRKLTDIALKSRNIDMFQETMRAASPAARKEFLDNGGERKLAVAFFNNQDDFKHAMEYAKQGELSAAAKVRDNTHWHGDNEKAIEATLAQMTAEQRKAYFDGKALSEGKSVEGLTAQQQQHARDYYKELHSALDSAGNSTEVKRWEDMIDTKGGTLVSRVTDRKSFWGDDVDGVLSDIEGMDAKEWARLKHDSAYRKKVEESLDTFLDESEMKRVRDLLDRKVAASTFEESVKSGRRDLIDGINDNTNRGFLWLNNKEDQILEKIERMTPEEQKRYREDLTYRRQVDQAVADTMEAGAERDAAMRLLNKVAKGQQPTADIVTKLNMHAAAVNTDEAKVIRDIQQAFKEDPTLRERIRNPQTTEDRELARQFNEALHRSLDIDEYERFARPLMETGRLSLETQKELSQGVFDDDEQGFYKDVLNLATSKDAESVAEKERILNDKEYQDKVLGMLSDDEREIALNALKQGEMRPEDIIRSHMVGAGTSEEEIKAELSKLSPEQLEQVKTDYARKYGTDLLADLKDEMGGQDAIDAMHLAQKQPLNDREAFNNARQEYYESRDGIGRYFVDNFWDGTGYMADDANNRFAAAMSQASSQFQSLPPEQRAELTANLQKNLDLFRESKAAAADAVVDAAVIVAAVGASAFTGGVSLALLAQTALIGAAFKVAAKSAIMGSDYDWGSSQVIVDAATGAVDAATIMIGPAQIANMARVGGKVSETASKSFLIEAGGLLAKDAEKAVAGRFSQLIAKGIAEGGTLSEATIKQVAKQFAKEGSEEAVEQALKKSIQQALVAESKGFLRSAIREATLNGAAGIVGGGASGGIRGAADWDSSKSFEENMAMVAEKAAVSAAIGGGVAFGATLAIKGIGYGINKLRGAGNEAEQVAEQADNGLANHSDDALARSTDDVSKNVEHLEVRVGDGNVIRLERQAGSADLDRVTFANGRVAEFREGKWIEFYPNGVRRSGKLASPGSFSYHLDADGTLVRTELAEQIRWRPDGYIEFRPNPQHFEIRGGQVSDEFVQTIEDAYMKLPKGLRELLANDQQKVVLGPSSTDIKPHLRGVQPRGWDKGKTWSMAEGLHDGAGKEIVVAEHYRVATPKGQARQFVKSTRPQGVFRHEAGHAIDQALNHMSDHQAFIAAYEKDIAKHVSRLGKAAQERLEYFLQTPKGALKLGSPAGRSEVFAEMFGVLYGGGSVDALEAELLKAFPNVKKLLEEELPKHH